MRKELPFLLKQITQVFMKNSPEDKLSKRAGVQVRVVLFFNLFNKYLLVPTIIDGSMLVGLIRKFCPQGAQNRISKIATVAKTV